MRSLWLAALFVLSGWTAAESGSWSPWRPTPTYSEPVAGSWVSLQVAVDDRATPLLAAKSGDGSRYYVEAHKGSRYELRLTNRSGERVGVELSVDGLNVISGERDRAGADRMYILAPGESTTIRGWRTSLEAVRRFTFVDEKVSYAARSNKANGKMGWIEMAVYREHHQPPVVQRPWREDGELDDRRAPAAPEAAAVEPKPQTREKSETARDGASAAGRSFPGTGWGERVDDQVRLVDFEAEAAPVERTTVRYEYRPALQALGLLPAAERRDRLSERERGEDGFAAPPRW